MLKAKKISILVVILYVLSLPGGAYLTWKFINNTSMTYNSPKGTLPYIAYQHAKIYFPKQLQLNPLYLLVTSQNSSESIVNNPKFELLSKYIEKEINNNKSQIYGIINDVVGYFLIPPYSEMRLTFIGGNFNQSSLLQLGIDPSLKINPIFPTIESFINTWCEENNADFITKYTSTDLLSSDASNGIISDLARVDIISLPLAFIVLGYCVGSIRLLIIPALSLPCTITIAFGLIMYPISLVTEISAFAPEITLGVIAAISVDYSLFILTRFREQVIQQEILLGKSIETEWIVIKKTAILSMHNIAVSGLTIAVAVGSLSFVPIQFLSTMGLTMSLSVICCIFVSLTVQPALLFVFYNFFARPPTWEEIWGKVKLFFSCFNYNFRRVNRSNSILINNESIHSLSNRLREDYNDNDNNNNNNEYKGTVHEKLEYKRQISSLWFRIGNFSIHHPFIAIFFVILFGVPFFYFATELRVDFNAFTQIPRDSPHGKVLKTLVTDFGGGSAIPFYITFTVKDYFNISYWTTDDMTKVMRFVIEEIVSKTNQKYDKITAPNMLLLPETNKIIWLNNLESLALYYLNEDYQFLINRTVSTLGGKSAYIILSPPIDPFGASANHYLNTIKDILNEHSDKNILFNYGMAGASSASWAIMSKSMEYFPLLIGITFGGIFIFILAVFRSIILPFRMVFTVAYTIAYSYGVGVVVFQYNWLHHVWKALDDVENYCFLIPIFAFLLLTALSLDYDVFLMTRVIEFKKNGYTNEAAIAKAVWKTGPIISFAGSIMFVTIGAMVFSSVMMLAQFGVICGAAVLLDTFIIRPFFAPALMSLIPEKVLWWPRAFPELHRDVNDMQLYINSTLNDIVHEEVILPESVNDSNENNNYFLNPHSSDTVVTVSK